MVFDGEIGFSGFEVVLKSGVVGVRGWFFSMVIS